MFSILEAFCSTLNSRIGELKNSIFDVTNRAFKTIYADAVHFAYKGLSINDKTNKSFAILTYF